MNVFPVHFECRFDSIDDENKNILDCRSAFCFPLCGLFRIGGRSMKRPQPTYGGKHIEYEHVRHS